MVEVFTTNVQDPAMADDIHRLLSKKFPHARISFDLDSCEKVLRFEDVSVPSDEIIAVVSAAGAQCSVMEDTVCAEHKAAEPQPGFWEASFTRYQTMWGFEPTQSAILANSLFLKAEVKDILIPGIGYGRNAQLFRDSGIEVTGIEISRTAIDLAKTHYGHDLKIHHGSVTDMPFDDRVYDGVFCYGLAYLLASAERKGLIEDCYAQLKTGGYMIFSVISTTSPNYGKGKQVGKDCFEIAEGARLFFYDAESVKAEFATFGMLEFVEIEEPVTSAQGGAPFRFWFITCRKETLTE